MSDIHATIKAAIAKPISPAPWSVINADAPIIRFFLNRDFDRYSKLLSYDFITTLHGISDLDIVDAYVAEGCIEINLKLDSTLDYQDRDIRQQIMHSAEYHAIFARYDVKSIYLYNFPNQTESVIHIPISPSGHPHNKA